MFSLFFSSSSFSKASSLFTLPFLWSVVWHSLFPSPVVWWWRGAWGINMCTSMSACVCMDSLTVNFSLSVHLTSDWFKNKKFIVSVTFTVFSRARLSNLSIAQAAKFWSYFILFPPAMWSLWLKHQQQCPRWQPGEWATSGSGPCGGCRRAWAHEGSAENQPQWRRQGGKWGAGPSDTDKITTWARRWERHELPCWSLWI